MKLFHASDMSYSQLLDLVKEHGIDIHCGRETYQDYIDDQ